MRLRVALVSLTMVLLAAACGKKNENAPVSSSVSIVNPSGFPVVKENITLTVFGSRDQNQAPWKEILFFKKYAEMTNITLDLQEIPAQGFEEKKNLLFASNDLPDLFIRAYISPDQFVMYGTNSGQIIALESYLPQYAPNINKIIMENNTVKSRISAADGHIYVLPQLDTSDTGKMDFKQWINKIWLNKLGLKAPSTPAELKEVLITFRDKDPNGNGLADEIPLGIREISSIYALGGSWGLDNQLEDTVNINDGKVYYWLKDKRFKEYLQFLNELFSERLIWQNYYKAGNRPEWRSNLANALYGAFYMPYSDVFLNVEDQFIGYPPLIGPYGDQFWADTTNGITTIGAFAISSSCKYPEAALRWVDYLYSEEGSILYRYGIEGETFTYDDEGTPRLKPEILNAPEGYMTALGKITIVPGNGGPHLITSKTDGVAASDLTRKISAELLPYCPPVIYSKPSLNESDQDRINAIGQDLYKYRDETVTRFIIGDLSFDHWDEYCATLDRIGLPEFEAIYQKAFDAAQGK
jgi:putative aldouronate transport system substrate-binding protein